MNFLKYLFVLLIIVSFNCSSQKDVERMKSSFDSIMQDLKKIDKALQSEIQISNETAESAGRFLNRQLKEENIIIVGKYFDTVESTLNKLLKNLPHRYIDIPISLYIYNDVRKDAFSIEGGFIWISSALIDRMNTESEMAFVLAHEIGHIVLGHCRERINYAVYVDNHFGKFGGVVLRMYKELSQYYDIEKEKEADEFAIMLLRNSNFNVRAGYSVLRMLYRDENELFKREQLQKRMQNVRSKFH